ncbi:non-specific lipid transfer protein GPI-anchored 25 [Andrographis paniculata]|uniref:non-specific lipid transfer protein GPI-anchored 25 n=1 Tax=Andrographis paniculata TaxID=175694 RepID=UPI0021E82986|nr:non-specific lipid transfer protein GPI-anchored 25 [Andrographis paniculata]
MRPFFRRKLMEGYYGKFLKIHISRIPRHYLLSLPSGVTVTAMKYALQIFLLFFFLLRRISIAAVAQTPAHSTAACSDELVAFSLCLPYVADSPNNLTDSPPPQCCDDISAALGNGSAICLCYFIRRPNVLGFPLNQTKLLSLPTVCPRSDGTGDNFTLEAVCSGPAALPPLQSITGPSSTMPHYSGAYRPPSSPASSPQGPSSSPTQEPQKELPTFTTADSQATEQTYRLGVSSRIILFTISFLYQLSLL